MACNASTVDGGVDGSRSDAPADVSTFDPDACAACTGSLAAECAADGSDLLPLRNAGCPPNLDTPAFQTWARDRIAEQIEPQLPICFQLNDCPEMLITRFNAGVDCEAEYIFDANTKKLVAVAEECNGHVSCHASDQCFPYRCMTDGGTGYATPSCPPMPDGGVVDAGAE